MRKVIYRAITISALILFTGCTPIVNKYRVSVDAITNPNENLAPTSYQIKALGKNTDENGLEFQWHTAQLINILNEKGYRPSKAGHLAEQTIYFDYGIDKVKEETQTYNQPNISFGFYHNYYHPFWSDFTYSSYRTYQETYMLYNRYIEILAKNQAGKELWRVDVSSVGESKNLKHIVPILLEASKEYIGKNTERPVNLVLKEKREKKRK